MLVSIHHRVPAIISGAEILLRMLLFWAMFLPLHLTWSLDQWRDKRRGYPRGPRDSAPVRSVASSAILLQMALLYLFSAIAKTNGQWFSGEALAGILQHDFYASPSAAWLLRFPRLLTVMTWGTLLMEWLAPFLLYFSRANTRLRLATITLLAAMHVGIGIFLEVGLFSLVSVTGLSLFLPAEFWNSRALARFCGSSEPTFQSSPFNGQSLKFDARRFATRTTCALALIYVLAVSINSLPGRPLTPLAPARWKALSRGLGLSQSLGMFGEIPSNDGWYVARAKLRNGSEVDLLRNGAAVNWNRPESPPRLYPNHYWQKLFREMSYFDEQGYQVWRAPVADYLCRDWNARHPPEQHVARFEFVFCMMNKIDTAAPPQTRLRRLVHLDFRPDQERPIVSGYDDSPQSPLPGNSR